MAVVGGYDSTVNNVTSWRDPWPQGIGIFDLTDMNWKDHYDPSAEPYRSPDAVKDWYARNGRFPSQWNNKTVQGWFTNIGMSLRLSSLSPLRKFGIMTNQGNQTESTISPANAGNQKVDSTGNKTGLIAGAAIGGSLAAVLIATLVWLLVRRRQRTTVPRDTSLQNRYSKAELHSDHAVKPELPSDYAALQELDSNTSAARPLLPGELGQAALRYSSAPSGTRKHELP